MLELVLSSEASTKTIFLAISITNYLSIVGCSFSIILTLILKNHKVPLIKMVIFISLMDLLYSIADLFITRKMSSNLQCQSMAFLLTFFFIGSLVWTSCFAHGMHSVIYDADMSILKTMLPRYIALSIVIPFLSGLYVVLIEHFRFDQGTNICWHDSQDHFYYKEFTTSTLPALAAILYCSYCYVVSIKKLWDYRKISSLELLTYPAILIICLLPAQVIIFYKFITKTKDIPVIFEIVMNVAWNLQGFMNSIVYGMPKMRRCSCSQSCLRRPHVKAESQKDSLLFGVRNKSQPLLLDLRESL